MKTCAKSLRCDWELLSWLCLNKASINLTFVFASSPSPSLHLSLPTSLIHALSPYFNHSVSRTRTLSHSLSVSFTNSFMRVWVSLLEFMRVWENESEGFKERERERGETEREWERGRERETERERERASASYIWERRLIHIFTFREIDLEFFNQCHRIGGTIL